MNDTIPSLATLAKLGSIIVHVEEMTSRNGHRFDAAALAALLKDPDVKKWRKAMDKAGLLPVMR